MKHVDIFTDGACTGNPGVGGWGAILRYGVVQKEISGASPQTTNNRMELTGVIQALRALKEQCDVTVTTDSKYVVDSINNGWVQQWKQNGWRKGNKQPAKNAELWDELLMLMSVHTVKFVWVKGHNGHEENERCDTLATTACSQINA